MDTVANWGWENQQRPNGTAWQYGTLEESFTRISRYGGRWILVSADPIQAFRNVMAETEKEQADASTR